ncbi:MAG: hypothetical protein VR64_22950 [Desulfatitalea sp. BRH_c12]|nr:MAG: hypothetical protein VR64_22950 [Desulfatitalea sp. BRH_c12]
MPIKAYRGWIEERHRIGIRTTKGDIALWNFFSGYFRFCLRFLKDVIKKPIFSYLGTGTVALVDL